MITEISCCTRDIMSSAYYSDEGWSYGKNIKLTEMVSTQSWEMKPRLRAEWTLMTCLASKLDLLSTCLPRLEPQIRSTLFFCPESETILSGSSEGIRLFSSAAPSATSSPLSSFPNSLFNWRTSKFDGTEVSSTSENLVGRRSALSSPPSSSLSRAERTVLMNARGVPLPLVECCPTLTEKLPQARNPVQTEMAVLCREKLR